MTLKQVVLSVLFFLALSVTAAAANLGIIHGSVYESGRQPIANVRVRLLARGERLVDEHLASRTAADWVQVLTGAGVPAGPVLNVEECFANEQVQTLPVVAEVEHPVLGHQRLLGPGVQMERTPPQVNRAAPEYGQHTDEVLREFGYSADDIDRFHGEGVV